MKLKLLIIQALFVVIFSFIIQIRTQLFGSCITPNQTYGECVYLRSCQSIFQLMISPSLNSNDENYISGSQCGYYNNSPLVCCPPEIPNRNLMDTPTTPRAPTYESFGNCKTPNLIDGYCIYLQECNSIYLMMRLPLSPADESYISRSQCGYHNNTPLVCCPSIKRNSLLPAPGVCGNSPIVDRIVGGEETNIDEYPWTALLEYIHPNLTRIFNCGGSLINERYVLTADHCTVGFDNPADWMLTNVILGEWDTLRIIDCEYFENGQEECTNPPLSILIEEVIHYPLYEIQNPNRPHDIALLRLQTPVQFTEFVKPICLPKSELLRTMNYNGLSLTVAGWGVTENGFPTNIKLKVAVDVVNLDGCVQSYRRRKFGANLSLVSNQLCAGGIKGKDACRGDSGGPLMGIDRNLTSYNYPYYYLAGIVSFGPTPCGLKGIPGVYTKVAPYVDWIESNLRE